MTWPDAIAAGLLTAFALLTIQHQSATRTRTPRRTEQRHGPHQQHPEDNHRTGEDRQQQDPGEEDHPGPAPTRP